MKKLEKALNAYIYVMYLIYVIFLIYLNKYYLTPNHNITLNHCFGLSDLLIPSENYTRWQLLPPDHK